MSARQAGQGERYVFHLIVGADAGLGSARVRTVPHGTLSRFGNGGRLLCW